ncbi:Hsp20/alpha crystallin family protein [Rubripirellula sp.]|jgi:HSP20 family protein|nr:Hsp20/alpha crystallin family protein [Planctomycetaceae bacterium]MDA9857018.1 Hsp20/alpha crystallin family protein [Rubripirellula sp.]
MISHNPFSQMNRFRSEIDRVLGVDSQSWPRATTFPAVNIWEDQDGFYVEAEIPGVLMDDLEIFVHEGDELSIKGKRDRAEGERHWHYRERGTGEFERRIKLSDAVDAEQVTAELTNGVLTISLPKREAVKPRQVKVKLT